MKLSEAILLGSTKNIQAFNVFKDPITQGTCALGAAMEAVGLDLNDPLPDARRLQFPLLARYTDCPLCQYHGKLEIGVIVTHLNDSHKLTRPQIAAWVAQQEQEPDLYAPEESMINSPINFAEPTPASGR